MYTNLFTIGNDIELRYTPQGKAVVGLALACDIGYKEHKRTSWIATALWDKRAEALADYLKKGQQVVCVLDDIELEQFTKKNNEPGAKIKARLVDIKLVRGTSQQQGDPERQPTPSQPAPSEFSDFDDDIPF